MGHGLRCVLDLIMPFGIAFITTDYRVCKGLQLCDKWESHKYGAAQCYPLYDGCQGASRGDSRWYDDCWPAELWSGSGSESVYYRGYLKQGQFTLTAYHITLPYSVRCVLDLR
mgnify:CR=1 FL=1